MSTEDVDYESQRRKPTKAEIRAVRRYLDPHMHIGAEIASVALGVLLVANAALALAGVVSAPSPLLVVVLALCILLTWVGDLVEKVRSERRRIARITAGGDGEL